MTETQNSKKYDLEERTYLFAKNYRQFIKELSRSTSNFEDSKQLIRSSGSVAANYIEANEALSKKDFIHRIKICRKAAKESGLWLKLVDIPGIDLVDEKRIKLLQESIELMKKFGAIIEKSK